MAANPVCAELVLTESDTNVVSGCVEGATTVSRQGCRMQGTEALETRGPSKERGPLKQTQKGTKALKELCGHSAKSRLGDGRSEDLEQRGMPWS